MRLLFLDEWVPYPLDSGKKLRTYNILRHLAEHHHITYVCYHDTARYTNEHLTNVTFVTVPDKRTRKGSPLYYLRIALNLFRRLPFSAEYAYSRPMQDAVTHLVGTKDFDLIMCEWTPYAVFFAPLDHPGKVLMSHNVEYQQWERMLAQSSNPFAKLLYWKQARSMQWFEKTHVPMFKAIVAVSELDRQHFLGLSPASSVTVAENGVDTEYFCRQPDSSKPCIVYTASMDAFVNQHAVIYFCNRIWPRLKRRIPQLTFYIVGRHPNRAVRNLGRLEGVEVTGRVDDVRDYVARAAVFVVPILAGGGTRLKIVEAMAMGIPVVSTSVGAEGLHVTHDRHLLIADDEEQFADYVVQCLQDRDLRHRLASSAYELVHGTYRWDLIGEKLNANLEDLIRS